MKKWWNIRSGAFLLAFMCMLGTSACSSTQTSSSSLSSSETSSVQEGDTVSHEESELPSKDTNSQTTIYGKVTAVDGNQITLEVGTLNARGNLNQPAGNDQQPPQANNAPDGERQEPAQQDAGAPSDAGAPGEENGSVPPAAQEGASELLTLTGESKTITITDESILSKRQMGAGRAQAVSEGNAQQSDAAPESQLTEDASLSEIQQGSILEITYQSDGETVSSVVILEGNTEN